MNYNCRVILLPECNMLINGNPLYPESSFSKRTYARKKALSGYMKVTSLHYE